MTRHLHHLATEADWNAALSSGEYRTSTRGRTLDEEGFIHASFEHQLAGVARRYFAGIDEPLVLLRIDLARVGCEVRLEVPPGGTEAYPHLYGPLPTAAVVDARPYAVPAAEARMHHPHLFASDLDATLRFYGDHFGAEVIADETLLGSRNVMVRLGDGRLNVYDQAPRATGRSAVHHLGIQVRDLAGVVGRLRDAGVELRKPIVEGEGFRYVMVEAPDGVLLELFEATEHAMRPAARPWFDWS